MNFVLGSGLLLTLLGIALLMSNRLQLKRPALALFVAFAFISHLVPIFILNIISIDTDATNRQLTSIFVQNAALMAGAATFSAALGYTLSNIAFLSNARSNLINNIDDIALDYHYKDNASIIVLSVFHAATLISIAILILVQPLGIVGFFDAAMTRVPFRGFVYSIIYILSCVLAASTCALMISSLLRGVRLPWFSIAITILLFFALGGRVQLVISALTFAICYSFYRPIRILPLIVFGVVMLLMSNITLYLRLTLQGAQQLGYLQTLVMAAEQSSALDGYAYADRYVYEIGFKPTLYIDSIRILIPRFIDDEKPEQLSRLMRLMVSRDRLGGLTNGLFGELFVIGGYLVVLIGSALYGAILNLFDTSFKNLSKLSIPVQTFIASLIPIFCLYLPRTGFDVSVFRIATIVLSCLAMWFAFKLMIFLRRRA